MYLSGLLCGIYLLFLQRGGKKKIPAVYFWRVKSGSFSFLLVCFKVCFPFFFLLFCSQVQAEVKKAWVRRSLTQDLKQKSRMTSSGGGGSSYYGGMMSHSNTHSVSLSTANPRSFPIGGVVGPLGPPGLRFSRHSSLCPQTDLPYTPGDAESSSPQQELTVQKPVGMESGICARHARTSKGDLDPKSQEVSPAQRLGAEEPDSSLSLKELETSLWLFYSDMLLCICKYWDWWPAIEIVFATSSSFSILGLLLTLEVSSATARPTLFADQSLVICSKIPSILNGHCVWIVRKYAHVKLQKKKKMKSDKPEESLKMWSCREFLIQARVADPRSNHTFLTLILISSKLITQAAALTTTCLVLKSHTSVRHHV